MSPNSIYCGARVVYNRCSGVYRVGTGTVTDPTPNEFGRIDVHWDDYWSSCELPEALEFAETGLDIMLKMLP